MCVGSQIAWVAVVRDSRGFQGCRERGRRRPLLHASLCTLKPVWSLEEEPDWPPTVLFSVPQLPAGPFPALSQSHPNTGFHLPSQGDARQVGWVELNAFWMQRNVGASLWPSGQSSDNGNCLVLLWERKKRYHNCSAKAAMSGDLINTSMRKEKSKKGWQGTEELEEILMRGPDCISRLLLNGAQRLPHRASRTSWDCAVKYEHTTSSLPSSLLSSLLLSLSPPLSLSPSFSLSFSPSPQLALSQTILDNGAVVQMKGQFREDIRRVETSVGEAGGQPATTRESSGQRTFVTVIPWTSL